MKELPGQVARVGRGLEPVGDQANQPVPCSALSQAAPEADCPDPHDGHWLPLKCICR